MNILQSLLRLDDGIQSGLWRPTTIIAQWRAIRRAIRSVDYKVSANTRRVYKSIESKCKNIVV